MTLLKILNIRNRLQEERCVFSEVTRSILYAKCVRSKHPFHTVRRNVKSCLWMQVHEWTVSPRLISEIWLLTCYIQNPVRQTNINWYGETRCLMKHPRSAQVLRRRHQFPRNALSCLLSIFVSSNVKSFHQGASFYIFEDNEAVIKIITKDRRPTMRHVSRTHQVALDRFSQIKYVDTKNQLADILTKGSFTRDEWNHLL